jgi:hypothetical protein
MLAISSSGPRQGLLLATGLLLGIALAVATTAGGLSWEIGAGVLGIGLAAIVGLSNTCSA